MDRIRIGLVGVGAHGARYAAHIVNDVPGLELAGLFQRDGAKRRAVAATLGVTAFESVESLVSSVDAVVIATPPSSHAPLIETALAGNRHVLVEKPVVRSAREALPLLAEDARRGGRVMVAHTLRYDPVIASARRLLPDVAPVRYVRMAQRPAPNPVAWQRDPEIAGGGSVLLTGVHLFDSIRWLLGQEIEITTCVLDRILHPTTEDFFLATGRTTGGIHLSMEVSKYSAHRAALLEVVGENGQLLGDYLQHQLVIGHGSSRTQAAGAAAAPTIPPLLRDFERFVRGEIANPIPLAEGVRAVAVADRCYEITAETP